MNITARAAERFSHAPPACVGAVPLTARLEPWQTALCDQPTRLDAWIEQHGSPINLLNPALMGRNAADLQRAGDQRSVDLRIFFARKANKGLAFVDEAKRLGLGIDVASERELSQALGRGVMARDLVVTAAVKPEGLLRLCVSECPTVVVDNADELDRLVRLTESSGQRVPVAVRLTPARSASGSRSRFGFGQQEALDSVDRHWLGGKSVGLELVGVHFHLDGYEAADRISAVGEALDLIDALGERGHLPTFIDIGGGIPMSYLESEEQWRRFWVEHRRGLLGEREPLTFDAHGLGLLAHRGEIIGRANVYPYHQELTQGAWLDTVLAGEVVVGGSRRRTVARALGDRGLQLRCEPGRSLLDGCGMTAARVEFRKQRHDGTWLIGLAMNRTQCRSTSDDFLLDPLLLRPSAQAREVLEGGPIDGYLVGAYCVERELLTWRRMHFPRGVQVGDIVVFPNTAGYLMHILESSSHQIPLARNLVITPGDQPSVDPIDDLTA